MAKGVKRSIYLYINGEEVENNIKAITAKMSKLINEQKKMTIGSDEYVAHAKRIKELRNVVDEHNQSLRSTQSQWDKLKGSLSSFGNIITGVTLGMQSVNQVIGSLKKMATDLAAMDDIYADVRKYTGMTLEEVKALNEEFKKLDTRTSREELNRLAGEAGKLGITGKENIMEFVDAANIINVALGEDLGEDAVKNIGKMAGMFGETDRLGLRGAMLATGSAINFIGQNSSAAEPYLMEFTARLSGTANQAKMTQAQILGYASVLDQNMQQVEMSATAMQNLIMKMMQNPAKFAKMAGIEVGKFASMLETDANGALLTFIETLNKKGGLTQLAPMFKEMGLDGVRASGVISVLAKDIDKVREEQEKANKAYQEGTSVTDEYAIKNDTLQAQLEKAKKKFQDMKLELGEKLYPVLLSLTKTSTGLIKIISSISSFISENKGLVIALASAWVAYLAIMVKGKVATLAMGVVTKANTVLIGLQKVAVLASSAAYNTMTGNATRAAAAQKMLKIAMASTPWGAILAAVTAIAVGIYKLATRQSEAEKAIKSFNSEAAKQEAEAMSLFSALKKTTKGTKDYKDILKIILEKYPHLLQNQVDEKGNLINLEAAYRSVTKAIRENTAEKIKAEATSEITVDYIENQKKQFDKLRKFMEKEGVASNLIPKIIEDINTELERPGSSYSDLNRIFKRYFGDYYSVYHKQAYSVFKKLRENMIDYKQEIGEIEKSFSPFLNKDKKIAGKEEEEEEEDTPGGGGGGGEDEKVNKYKEYLEKLAALREKYRLDKLSAFDKEIEETKKAYDEMIAMANEFSDKENAAKLEEEKWTSIEAIVSKHADAINKKVEDIYSKNKDNPLLQAVFGEAKKYDDLISDTDLLINSLKELNKTQNDPELAATIEELINRRAVLVSTRTKEVTEIIDKEAKKISTNLLSEHDKQIQSINERYDQEELIIRTAIEEKKKLGLDSNSEEIKMLEELLAKLGIARKKDIDEANKTSIKGKLAKMLGIEEEDFEAILSEAQKFFSQLGSSTLQILENRNQKEIMDYKNSQSAQRKMLEDRLNSGVISQDQYNKQVSKLDEALDKKERELNRKQFNIKKAANIAEATISGIVAAIQSFENGGGYPWGLITMALSVATTGLQIGAIASEPNPYALGGFIKNEQIIRAGEKGPEWMASNRLLTDPATAPIIQALENYQRGKTNGFNALGFSTPSVSESTGSYTSTQTSGAIHTDDVEYKKSIIRLEKHMSDPKNRQSTINRELLLEFDGQETTLRNLANI